MMQAVSVGGLTFFHCARSLRAALVPVVHSITSSARASNVGGTSSPSVCAVFRLMTRSNLVGRSAGMSAGFVPRRILSANSAARRNRSREVCSVGHQTSRFDVLPPFHYREVALPY
jgi:hypothetical protein